jgi:hypothetical protein
MDTPTTDRPGPIDRAELLDALDRRVKRRDDRRDFFKLAGGFAAGAAGTLALTACGGGGSGGAGTSMSSASAQGSSSAPTDPDILNFALNLEYLEANFYHYAVFGTSIPASLMSGAGTQGEVLGGEQVAFTDPVVAAYAKEIATDEIAHVTFLRSQLGTSAVAMPQIDVSATPTSAFSMAAQAAGLVPAGTAFSPYTANGALPADISFLLGAYIFEDVGVTAYKGAAPLISNATYLGAAAGILATEAYHAGLIRSTLYSKGVANPSYNTVGATAAISKARASLDGTNGDDQGIGGADATISNIVDADSNAIAYSRTTAQVLNIVFLNPAAVTMGGFFPNGVNGNITMSG